VQCLRRSGGALYAYYSGFISPDDFGLARSIMLLAMLTFGGDFSNLGEIVGAFFLTCLREWLRGGVWRLFGGLRVAEQFASRLTRVIFLINSRDN